MPPATKKWLASQHFEQVRCLSLKIPGGFDKLGNISAELRKGRNLTATEFIPMPLVDSEQLDEEHHRVIFSQPIFTAPLGDGLVELLVEVGLFRVRHGGYFADSSKFATDSISV